MLDTLLQNLLLWWNFSAIPLGLRFFLPHLQILACAVSNVTMLRCGICPGNPDALWQSHKLILHIVAAAAGGGNIPGQAKNVAVLDILEHLTPASNCAVVVFWDLTTVKAHLTAL